MKKIVLVFIAVFLTVSGFAQKTADIGIWGGTSSYWGDVKGTPPIQAFNPNFGAYFRYNFNKRVGLRFQFLTGKFAADGTVEGKEWAFEKNAQDVSLMAEINYLNFVLGNKKTPFTPYILAGVGVMYFPFELSIQDIGQLAVINDQHPLVVSGTDVNESSVTASVPLGFGIKFSIGERLGIGAEYMVRKIFNDKLDDLEDPLKFPANVNGEETINYTNFLHNNDWPGYMGVHITYKIYLSQKACPAYDRKYW
ncbi:MAG: DUF6089 family protein [Tangfeifania sp.]